VNEIASGNGITGGTLSRFPAEAGQGGECPIRLLARNLLRPVTAVFDKPFVKKSALIGTENFPMEFYEELKGFSRRELLIFKTREEALAWLLGDSAGA